MVNGSRAERGRVGDRETREMAGPGIRSKLSFARLKAGAGFRWLAFETEVLKRKEAHSYWLEPCHLRSQTPPSPRPHLPGVTPAQGKALKSIFI